MCFENTSPRSSFSLLRQKCSVHVKTLELDRPGGAARAFSPYGALRVPCPFAGLGSRPYDPPLPVAQRQEFKERVLFLFLK